MQALTATPLDRAPRPASVRRAKGLGRPGLLISSLYGAVKVIKLVGQGLARAWVGPGACSGGVSLFGAGDRDEENNIFYFLKPPHFSRIVTVFITCTLFS